MESLNNIKEQLHQLWLKIQDSDIYIKLRERYQALSPNGQKIALILSSMMFLLILVFIPWMNWIDSSDSVTTFEDNVQVVRDLLKVQRELANAPDVQEAPEVDLIKSQVKQMVSQLGIANDMIRGEKNIEPTDTAFGGAGIVESGYEIILVRLNLKQVVDLGTRLSQLSPSLHLMALDIKSNSENDHYYDAVYRVSGFSTKGDSPSSDKGRANKDEKELSDE